MAKRAKKQDDDKTLQDVQELLLTARDQQRSSGEYPLLDTPLIYCEGVSNVSYTKSTVKFYLRRYDQNMVNTSIAVGRVVSQLVMPMEQFLNTVMFFEDTLRRIIADGTLSQKDVDAERAKFLEIETQENKDR